MEVNANAAGKFANPIRSYGGDLSFAVCTNRPENLRNAVSVAAALGQCDEMLVVLDLRPESVPTGSLEELLSTGVRILENFTNKGLSYSRNRALDECANRILVYIDDDVTLVSETVEAIRSAQHSGSGIVGVLLVPEFHVGRRRWWLNGGQYHYLGVHHRADRAKPWGACMAINAQLANEHGIRFRDELGRRGQALQSGDDTSFLAELRAAGASESVLTGVSATHHISPDRERLTYLLRRAWWQGRSEYRRGSLAPALLKEWGRNVGAGPAQAPILLRYALGTLFVSSVVVGGVSEMLLQWLNRWSSA